MSPIILYKLFVFLVGFLTCWYILKVAFVHRREGRKNLETFHYFLVAIIAAFILFILSIPMETPTYLSQPEADKG